MADPTYTVVEDNYNLTTAADNDVEIELLVNAGTYATNGIALTPAVVNAALLVAGHGAHETVSSIKSVVASAVSLNGLVHPVWDSANSKVKVFSANGGQAAITVTTAATLAVSSHVSTALPAGALAPIAVEILAGDATGICTLTPTAPAATKTALWDPSARTLSFLAADNVSSAKVQYWTWTTNALSAEIAHGADLSNAAYSFRLSLVCTK